MKGGDGSSTNHTTGNNNINKLTEDKVPKIRLKLKVPIKVVDSTETGTGSESVKEHETSTDSINAKNSSILPKDHISPIVSNSSAFYGTFKYRPFKLFPLLPPSSRYRVLIPSKHINNSSHHLNPALKLNYLWQPSKHLGGGGFYTDDSDLVCMLIKEGWIKNFDNVKGRNLLVEVEIVGEEDLERHCIQNYKDINNSGKNDGRSTTNYPTDTADYRNIHPVNTRPYDGHDGHYIRITSCTIDPSTVHLKRWRKPTKSPANHQIVTPNFKTKS
jgi:hypothetical protein